MAGLTLKVDELLPEQEMLNLMKLSEISLTAFLEEEPDIYSLA